ncbi:Bug family tripartite tricarboxylate transporter substrate binding protein [Humitalea sp. 24SJ18S-53]|uniref:Bug family tripartite tricarboxylate transporter substrate binding protein n=1 Tax=Humitalea sp. 24SJ18S-53 TaxID=3422307 RepID=UPI003D66DDF6
MTGHAKLPLSRRALLGATALLTTAADEPYPNRPVRILLGLSAGGLADISARIVAQSLTEKLGAPFVVENRPSAGGIVAAQAAARSAPDGHTLIFLSSTAAISKALFRSLPYDPIEDFTPIISVIHFDLVLMTSPTSAIRSVADLRAPRARPLTLGTHPNGTTQYLLAEMLRLQMDLPITLVPYRSTPELFTALQRGDVDVTIDGYAALSGQFAAGAVRPLASSGRQRSALLPDVPTFAEVGVPNCELLGWNALFAPARTPQSIVNTLHREVLATLRQPTTLTRIRELGVEVGALGPEDLAARLRDDIATYNSVIDRSGMERL